MEKVKCSSPPSIITDTFRVVERETRTTNLLALYDLSRKREGIDACTGHFY